MCLQIVCSHLHVVIYTGAVDVSGGVHLVVHVTLYVNVGRVVRDHVTFCEQIFYLGNNTILEIRRGAARQ